MASAPTFQFPLRVEAVGADPDGPEVAEQFVLDLRRELAEVDVTRVERVPGGPAPEGARALELIAVFELVITAVQAGEALTKVVRAVRRVIARYAERRQAVRLTIAGEDVDLGTPGDVERVVARLLTLPAQERGANRSALIVANARYDDPALAALRSPGHDAEALVRVLGDPAVGGFQAEALVDADERTIRRRVATFFAGRDRDDVLLLHFSCHGVKDARGRLHLAARDTDLSVLGATAIPATFVNDLLAETQSRRVVLILDCCYSGAFARGAAVRAGDDVPIADEFGAGTGRIVLTASSATEYSFEDGELTRSQGRPSAFTGALVRGLESGDADLDGDGEISIDELYDYTYRAVRDTATGQAPMKWSYGMEGSLLVARSVRPAALPTPIVDDLASDRVVLRLEGVRELERVLRGGRAGLQSAARAALERLRDNDDSVRVRTAAAAALGEVPASPAVERRPPEPVPAKAPEAKAPAAVPVPEPAKPTPTAHPTTAPRPGRLGGLLVAASLLVWASAVLYLIGQYVAGAVPFPQTWFVNLALVVETAAAVALLSTRQVRWAGLLAGVLCGELLLPEIFWNSYWSYDLPDAQPRLMRLANVVAIGALTCALVAVLLDRQPAGVGWPRRIGAAVLVAAVSIPTSVVAADLQLASFVYELGEKRLTRIALALICGAVPALVYLLRPASPATPWVSLGWLLGGVQVALVITVYLGQKNSYGGGYLLVPWLLLGAVLIATLGARRLSRPPGRRAEPLR